MKRLIFISVIVCLIFGFGVIPIKAQDLTKGLMGYWPLDENGKDMVGKSKGELEGGAKWIKNGRVKGAVELDGVTGHVVITGFELVTLDLTALAWFKGWRQDAWASFMCSRNDPMSFWIGFTDADTLSYVWNNNSDKTWGWRQGPKIPQEEWAMIAMTIAKDQAIAYIYTDAKKMQSAVNKIDHVEQTIANNLKFGWDQCCGAGRHIKGIIDEVMIYNRVLSEAELVKLATTGLAVERIDKLTTQWGKLKQ